MNDHEHYCADTENYPTIKFLQSGVDKGKKILIVGEAPARNGWRKSGRAFYNQDGKLLASGRNLNKLLVPYGLSIEVCAFTELIKCFVGTDRQQLNECGRKCWPIFTRQVASGDYKLILILGVKTLEVFNTLSGSSLKIGEIGSLTFMNKNYLILPIYHPSPINPYNHSNNVKIFNTQHDRFLELVD